MFDFVAKHKRLLQFVLLLIIIPPFALWGVQSYQSFMHGDPNDVAEVGGQKITSKEFSEALQAQQDRLRGMLGGKVDAALLDSPEMRRSVLDGLISQRLVAQYAVRGNFNVTDDQLQKLIMSIPAFQDGGKFSRARYEAALQAQGFTPASFDNSLRSDLITQQVAAGVAESAIASRAVAVRMAAVRAEQREVSELPFPAAQFQAQVKATPEAVQAYYDANKQRFSTPEQVRAEYVVLSADALAASSTVSADDVKKAYEANKDKYGQPEQRQASHILVAFKQGATDADKAQARDKAARLLAEVRKAPDSFAEVAKKNSDDPGSAARGGDLGYFSHGMMVKPFDDAVFSMKQGEIRGPVESEFGVHIIRLTGIKPAKMQGFDEVKSGIEGDLRKQDAQKRFSQAAEDFNNTVYEQGDSLKPVADKFKLNIQQAGGWATRQSSPDKQLDNPKVLGALFSDDVVRNHHNTEVVEISPGKLLAARVVEYKAAAVRPLAEVRDDVVKALTASESAKLAEKQGQSQLDALKKGEGDATRFGAARLASRDNLAGLNPQAARLVFSADVSKLPAFVGADTPAGYSIYRITRVVPGPSDDARQKGMQAELARLTGTQEFRAFLAGLRNDAKVTINQAALDNKQQDQQ
jgi:peptidyl-prolyl cis-trans isomerase D